MQTTTPPGLHEIRAAFNTLLALDVPPLTARDWLVDHVNSVTRHAIDNQVAGTGPTAPSRHEDPATISRNKQIGIRQLVLQSLQVYNGRRPHLTIIDQNYTEGGRNSVNAAARARAAANRAAGHRTILPAAIRQMHVDRIEPAPAPTKGQTSQIKKGRARSITYHVAAVIDTGDRVRAVSIVLTEPLHRPQDRLQLSRFNVL